MMDDVRRRMMDIKEYSDLPYRKLMEIEKLIYRDAEKRERYEIKEEKKREKEEKKKLKREDFEHKKNKKFAINFVNKISKQIEKLKITDFNILSPPDDEPEISVDFGYRNLKLYKYRGDYLGDHVQKCVEQNQEYFNLKNVPIGDDTKVKDLVSNRLRRFCEKQEHLIQKEFNLFLKSKKVVEAVQDHNKNRIKLVLQTEGFNLSKKDYNSIYDDMVTEEVVES